jgi:hypothetical protein
MATGRTEFSLGTVELAAAHGIKLQVSKRERLERQTVIDPIPALFVCCCPTGPLNLAAADG